MAAAAEQFRNHHKIVESVSPIQENIDTERENNITLARHITYLDHNARAEGLTDDWWSLRYKFGFSMQKQMDLLPYEFTSHELGLWLTQTMKDVKAYTLEYLNSDAHAAYSSVYEVVPQPDGARDLIDVTYQKDMLAVISDEERNGSVKDSSRFIRSFFLDDRVPTGSLAVMISPKGETGMMYDDGTPKPPYEFSYMFIGEKVDEKTVKTYGLKTDFCLRECREAIYVLTGSMLPSNAPLEQYVRTIALLVHTKHSSPHTATDVVNILQAVRGRFDPDPSHACERITWDMIRSDISQAEALYDIVFDETSRKYLSELPKYIIDLFPDHADRLSIQKAVAATVLRLTEHFVRERQKGKQIKEIHRVFQNQGTRILDRSSNILYDHIASMRIVSMRYGDIMEQAEKMPGCAGGSSRSSLSLGEVLGFEREESYSFDQKATCRMCGEYREDCGPCNICKSCDKEIKRIAAFR